MPAHAPILEIVYGTTRVSLLGRAGFTLESWKPTRAPFRNVWGKGAMADGRQLVDAYRENVISKMTFNVTGASQNQVIAMRRQLDQVLGAAKKYWFTDYADTPAYLAARGHNETYTRYAIIKDYSMPSDDEAYSNPFATDQAEVVQRGIALTLEHTLWRSDPPGGHTDIELSGELGGYGRAANTDGEAFVANYSRTSGQITHIFMYTAGAGWSGNLQGAAKPTSLFPGGPYADGDALYFGIEVTGDEPPFNNLVFDVGTVSDLASGERSFQYYDGAWAGAGSDTLQPSDQTRTFSRSGVNAVSWFTPDDWETVAVNGVTGWWVRMRFDAPTNPVTSPTQQNRDIYTCHWSAVKTTSDQLAGDLRSLLSLYLQAQYDSDPPVANENGAWASELYIGTRSASRAVGTFQPNINLIDLYNPSGVDVTVGAIYCTVSGGSGDTGGTPLGKYVAYSHAGAGPPYIFETLATISLGDFPAYSTAISDYTGQYHAYLRYNVPSGDDGDLLVRLSVGYSDPYTYLQTIPLDTLANMRMADLGIINIPADGGRSGYNQMKCDLILTIQNTSGAARTASFYDLILMPCDELFFVANRNTSQWVSYTGVCVLDGTGGYKHSPVLGIMTYAGTIGVNPSVDVFSGGWLYRGVAPLSLQSNADQEIWFLSAMDLGVHPEITFPDFAPLISVSANTVAQYESMRGAS